MEIIENIVKENRCYQAGKKIQVKGLMLHSVGCPQPSAEVFVKQHNSSSAKVCVHAFIDANTGKIYQTLPWNHRAWHCGGNGNATHIGVEMCEPPCIRYTSGANFVCSDGQRAEEMVTRTLKAAVELFAFLCKEYGLDPLADGVILSHKEAHDRGIASGHGDPDHLFSQLPMDYSMDRFRQEVAEERKKYLTADSGEMETASCSEPAAGTQPVVNAVSDRGVELIARYEGCRLEAYLCPAGVWTIGYGHTAGVEKGQTLPSKEAAKALLKEDLKKYGDYVNDFVSKGLIRFPLSQNQFDALTSFCYNCGNGNLRKLVSDRSAAEVADKMLLYNKGGGKVLPGLVKRREEERALFLS
ncbi:MAG: N-acetylmuramoyl-L-alanine amidase [Lachnospiraceae bacterium]|nr:N-acetylmuramoyl-L-alanine amidase [Lachnospiraceae bacterium]